MFVCARILDDIKPSCYQSELVVDIDCCAKDQSLRSTLLLQKILPIFVNLYQLHEISVFFEIFGQETSYLHILFHEPPFFTSLLIRLSNPCPQLVPCQGTSYGPSATAQLLEDATYGEGIAHED